MQAGASLPKSLGTPVTPLPVSNIPPSTTIQLPVQHHHHHPPPPPPTFTPYGIPKPDDGVVKPVKRLDIHKPPRGPQIFSLFPNLQSLAILDMDTLENISEIANCIASSITSLKELKISFSEALALKARKKRQADSSDTESSHDDDDLMSEHTLPPPLPPAPFSGNSSLPSTDAEVRRERLAQEKVLALVFGLEKESTAQKGFERIVDKAIATADKESQAATKLSPSEIDRTFMKELKTVMQELEQKKGVSNNVKDVKTLDVIERAASKYLERSETAENQQKKRKKVLSALKRSAKKTFAKKFKVAPINGHKLVTQAYPTPLDFLEHTNFNYHPQYTTSLFASTSVGNNHTVIPSMNPAAPQNPQVVNSVPLQQQIGNVAVNDDHSGAKKPSSSLFQAAGIGLQDTYLDDVDIEHPDHFEDEGEDQEFVDRVEEPSNEFSVNADYTPGSSSKGTNGNPVEEQAATSSKGKEPVRRSVAESEHSTAGPSGSNTNAIPEPSGQDAIQEYIRVHHGISLESLSIHLIPVKPSILCRAIDMYSLKHISLLNVGPQRSFWAMLSKLHKITPLRVESVHSDNVTPSFLEFLNGLDRIKELIMCERSSRSSVESLAPKSSVTITDIRKQVLKKHSKYLEWLMIRNDEDSNWALDKESVKLLTKYGSRLKELVVGVDTTNFVSFPQALC